MTISLILQVQRLVCVTVMATGKNQITVHVYRWIFLFWTYRYTCKYSNVDVYILPLLITTNIWCLRGCITILDCISSYYFKWFFFIEKVSFLHLSVMNYYLPPFNVRFSASCSFLTIIIVLGNGKYTKNLSSSEIFVCLKPHLYIQLLRYSKTLFRSSHNC